MGHDQRLNLEKWVWRDLATRELPTREVSSSLGRDNFGTILPIFTLSSGVYLLYFEVRKPWSM